MARRDALLKLHKRLVARRNELRKVLAGELKDLRGFDQRNLTGDAADAAFDTGSDEISSQLAELEARELAQVERALAQLRRWRPAMLAAALGFAAGVAIEGASHEFLSVDTGPGVPRKNGEIQYQDIELARKLLDLPDVKLYQVRRERDPAVAEQAQPQVERRFHLDRQRARARHATLTRRSAGRSCCRRCRRAPPSCAAARASRSRR